MRQTSSGQHRPAAALIRESNPPSAANRTSTCRKSKAEAAQIESATGYDDTGRTPPLTVSDQAADRTQLTIVADQRGQRRLGTLDETHLPQVGELPRSLPDLVEQREQRARQLRLRGPSS